MVFEPALEVGLVSFSQGKYLISQWERRQDNKVLLPHVWSPLSTPSFLAAVSPPAAGTVQSRPLTLLEGCGGQWAERQPGTKRNAGVRAPARPTHLLFSKRLLTTSLWGSRDDQNMLPVMETSGLIGRGKA